MMRRSRERQRGQAIVIAAVAMGAMLAMSGLVLMGGSAYWERTHLQEVADSAALAGATTITASCSTITKAPITAAEAIVASQIGSGSGLAYSSSSCLTGYVATDTFQDNLLSGSVSATFTYPYNGDEHRVEVQLAGTIPLQLSGILGASSATIQARAVAEYGEASLPGTYALYAEQGISCAGYKGATIQVQGSIYSGDVIDQNCSIYAEAIKSGTSYQDFGDIVVYPPQPGWQLGSGSCTYDGIVSSNAICSDGFEISGNASGQVTCGIYRSTDYMDLGQGSSVNPNPCASGSTPPVVPAPNILAFIPAEPNLNTNAQATIDPGNPQACPSGRSQGSTGTISYASQQSVYVPGRSFTLTAASGTTPITSLTVSNIPDKLTVQKSANPSSTDVQSLTLLDTTNNVSAQVLLSATAAAGSTTISITNTSGQPWVPTENFPANKTTVTPTYATPVGTVDSALISKLPTLDDATGIYTFYPGCYGYLDISQVHDFGSGPMASLAPGFYFFNGAGYTGSKYGGGLCLGSTNPGDLSGSDVSLEFVNGTSFSTADCSSTPNSATAAPGFQLSAPSGSKSWCPAGSGCQNLLIWAPPYQYTPPPGGLPLCQNQGTFYVKGPQVGGDKLTGTIYWPGQPSQQAYAPCTPPPTGPSAIGNNAGCQYTANPATSSITGQLLCYSVNTQGGGSGTTFGLGVDMAGGGQPQTPEVAGLIE